MMTFKGSLAFILMFIGMSAHAEFGILAPIGISIDKFKSLKVYSTCKAREGKYPDGYIWLDCEKPEDYIEQAHYLFLKGTLVGVETQLKEVSVRTVDWAVGDDQPLLSAVRDKIKSKIQSGSVDKIWADTRSATPFGSGQTPQPRLEFPLETYKNDQFMASISYVKRTFYTGEVDYIAIGCTMGTRPDLLAYLDLMEKAKAATAKAEEDKAKQQFNLDSKPASRTNASSSRPTSAPQRTPTSAIRKRDGAE